MKEKSLIKNYQRNEMKYEINFLDPSQNKH